MAPFIFLSLSSCNSLNCRRISLFILSAIFSPMIGLLNIALRGPSVVSISLFLILVRGRPLTGGGYYSIIGES